MLRKITNRLGLDISLVKITSTILSGNLLSQGFRYIFWFSLVWIVTVKEYGEIRYAMVMAGFLSLPVVYGFGGAITKFISEHRTDSKFQLYAFHTILVDLLMLALMLLVTGTLSFLWSDLVPGITVFFILILAYYNLYYASVRGVIDIRRMVLFGVLVNGMRVLFLLIFYLFSISGVYPTIIAYGLPIVIVSVILTAFRRETVDIRSPRYDRTAVKRIVRFSVPGFTNAFFVMFISQVNIPVIKLLSGVENVAYYSLAFTIANMIVFISTAVTSVQMPSISGLKGDITKINEQTRKYFRMGVVAIVSAAALLSITIPLIFMFLPSDYSSSIPILYALIPGAVFAGLFAILSATWVGYGRPTESLKAAIFGSPTILLMDLILIPMAGLLGAAISYSIAEAVVFLLLYLKTRRSFS